MAADRSARELVEGAADQSAMEFIEGRLPNRIYFIWQLTGGEPQGAPSRKMSKAKVMMMMVMMM